MSYEQKVLAVFAGLVLLGHLAVMAFIWRRSRMMPEPSLDWRMVWWMLSVTLLLTGALLTLVFSDTMIGNVGFGMFLVGMLSKIISIISMLLAGRRTRDVERPTSETPPSP